MRAGVKAANVSVLIWATLLLPAGTTRAQVADSIYAGGDIITVNDNQPTAEAVAVKDGKILAVGARSAIELAHKGKSTAVVDLAGKTLLPSSLRRSTHCTRTTSLWPISPIAAQNRRAL